MFTEMFYKLSLSVCVSSGQNALKALYLSNVQMAELTHTYTAWVYIYPAHDARSKDPIDGPKDHLSRISCSNHQH